MSREGLAGGDGLRKGDGPAAQRADGPCAAGRAPECEAPSCECAVTEDGAKHSEASSFSCSEEAARLIGAHGDAALRKKKQGRRERVALAVFAALVLAGFVVLTSYISNAGRGLNVAATSIDDVAGDMSGYDVVIFEGTAQETETKSPGDRVQGPFAADSADAPDEGEGASSSKETTILLPKASDTGVSASSEEADEQGRTQEQSREDASFPAAGESGADDASDGVMTVDEARAIYEGKKASVIEVDPESLRDYVSGRIIMKDGHTYGIFSLPPDMAPESFMPLTTTTKTTTTTVETSSGAAGSVDEKTTRRVKSAYASVSELFAATDPDSIDPALVEHIEDVLKRFESAQVDTVVAFTSDPTPFSAVEGVDAVITFKTRDRFSMSEVIDGTLYFDAPEKGSVGVLMIAPGNVASTKVLTEQ